ncbi:hypothetical protein Bca4012_006729 [Brassica carinata]
MLLCGESEEGSESPGAVAGVRYESKECLERVTQTVSFLASPVGSLLLLLTGDAQRDRAAELLGAPCVFKPHLSSKLGNE